MTAPTDRVLLGLPSLVLFPNDVATVDVQREENARALRGMDGDDLSVLVGASHDPGGTDLDAIRPIGTLARVIGRTRLPNGGLRIVLQGIRRATVESIVHESDCLWAHPGPLASPPIDLDEARVETERLQRAIDALGLTDPPVVGDLAAMIPLYIDDLDRVTDLVATVLPLELAEQQALLGEPNALARLAILNQHLERRIVLARAERTVDENLASRIRRKVMRERLDALREELGETGTFGREVQRYRERLEGLDVSPQTRDAFEHEIGTLRRLPHGSPEAARLRSHLDWAFELPWTLTVDRGAAIPFASVADVLTASHIGLDDVKQRIAEILAIRQLGGGAQGTVLCFYGPPGTGKSSMARAVATALRRPLVTIPVGAMMHERELVGASSRRDGASPGAIMTGIQRAGTADPVILLDEIDKISLGGEGTAAGPLLALLDPEHNAEFVDNYLGVPFDLSRSLFLATANDVEELPETLLDRMEFLAFHGYTESEKYAIGRQHLLPRAREHAGIPKRALKVSPGALRSVIRGYTEEAGIRHLNRLLVSLARKSAVEVVKGGTGLDVKQADLFDLLGPRTVDEEIRVRRPAIGVATGLAWTSVGGALLPIEALVIPGSGRMTLTGQVGEVMRESVQTAVSYLRTCFDSFGLEHDTLDVLDVHLHFPAAATPKDGPSAGIAIASALVSLFTNRAARHDVAMTGEMSLLGAVFPVGGLREKLLAAIRCGIPEVIVPARNAEEVLRLPAEIRDNLEIHLVERISQVFEIALLQRGARLRATSIAVGSGPRKIARRAKKDSDVA